MLRDRRTKRECAEQFLIMAGVMNPKKKRKKHVRKSPRNDMREKKLERDIIWHLNMDKELIAFKNGEQSTYNGNYILDGMADLTVFDLRNRQLIYMEVKEGKGEQRDTQHTFEGLCRMVGAKYCVVKSVEEAKNACR